MYCDRSISEASMYMSMHCEVWTEVSRLALGPLVLIRARFCPRGPRWVYLILGLGLTDSLHIFDIHNFDHIPNFGWWRISTTRPRDSIILQVIYKHDSGLLASSLRSHFDDNGESAI